MKILAVSCAHTLMGLRCARRGVKGFDEELIDDVGHISKDKVYSLCPSYAKPVAEGLRWLVIRSQVDKAVEGFANFVQESSNLGHGAERLQSKVQTLLQIHDMIIRNKKRFNDPKVDQIVREIEKTKPWLKGHVGPMTDFVRLYSGGDVPVYITQICAYAKQLGDARKDLSAQTFAALGAVSFVQGPEWMAACVKASLAAPDAHCRDGLARLLTTTDVQNTTKPALKLK
eukprot:3367531-Pyramimonas_sp.AAC.1